MITKDTKVLDIVSKYPETQKIFSSYDKIIGKCLMCNHLFDSLESITVQYGLNLLELLEKLNKCNKGDIK